MKRLMTFNFLCLMIIGCIPLGGPENAARAAFTKWADEIYKVPYQNVQVSALENDGTFATVKITAEYRADNGLSSPIPVGQPQGIAPTIPHTNQEFALMPTARGMATATAKAQAIIAEATATGAANISKLQALGMIAFFSTRNWTFGIYAMNADGSEVRSLYSAPGRTLFPAWSPDNRSVAFLSEVHPYGDRSGGFHLDILGVENKTVRRLVDNVSMDSISWSPDGKRIAFSTGKICVVMLSNAEFQCLVEGKSPSWSPDGQQIIFADSQYMGGILVMDINGGNVRRLAEIGGNPVWSPDGKQIAYDKGGIWLMNSDGTNARKIFDDQTLSGTFLAFTWSPDSEWIAFGSLRDHDNVQIFAIDAQGKNLVKLTNLPSDGGMPSWSH
ncbi:MAG: PD40 domain-containing protein [Chloroflexi bacterium]|nr:PD40 domain-containing protein [Chloroflexota bacterium]